MKYEEPNIEVVMIELSDVVCLSSEENGDFGGF